MIADILREHLNGSLAVRKCKMGVWLASQEEDVQTLFDQLLQKPGLNVSALYQSLADDLPFKSSTFKMHLKGNCTCPKTS